MEKTLPSSKLYSHPDRLLEDHLAGVARLSELFLSEKPSGIQNSIAEVCRVSALCHDLGKSTEYFQHYLLAGANEKEKLKNSSKAQHSLLSAICAYFVCKGVTSNNNLLPFFAYLSVRRHHGNLKDIIDEATLYNVDNCRFLEDLIEHTDRKKFSILVDNLKLSGLPLSISIDHLRSWAKDFISETRIMKRALRQLDKKLDNYLILNLLYSVLLDADKSDAVIKDISYFTKRQQLNDDLIDKYKSRANFKDSPINSLREMAYQEVMRQPILANKRIYSLNLPTGLGKTLTSLSFALKLRDKLGQNHRIIYALPFLSIIDQNSQIFESVLKENGIKPHSNVLLKHHHFSDLYYSIDNGVEFESEEAKIFIEGWNSELIITTFMQLFHSLISNQNKSLRKFHRLANSIIILDEIQSIPIKYWLLLKNLFIRLTETLDTYVIFVTATQPLIFDRDEIKDIANQDFYFSQLDRITINPELDKDITLEELIDSSIFEEGKTYLVILNTISAARTFYHLLSQRGLKAAYLSTHITPKERKVRIKEIKNGLHKIVISTQLVEAGVDIDFDVVIRDLAPLDSINQAAGRCNRNGSRKGEVYVISLKDERDRYYSSYVYDIVLVEITRKILKQYKEIKESSLPTLINEYYQEVNKKKSQDISKEILEAIMVLKYDSEGDVDKYSVSSFKLIEEDYSKIDVFVELDEEASELWQKFINLKNIDDLFKRKRYFDSIKADFYQYVISIPKNAKNRPPIIGDLGYIENSKIQKYYDSQTGFILKDETSIVIC